MRLKQFYDGNNILLLCFSISIYNMKLSCVAKESPQLFITHHTAADLSQPVKLYRINIPLSLSPKGAGVAQSDN